MCIPGAFFPLLTLSGASLIILSFCFSKYKKCYYLTSWWLTLLYVHISFSHKSFAFFFFFFFLFPLSFHTHGEPFCRMAKSWPGRKTCTFSIFVLCTALLILNPIIYYLNPSMEKKKKKLLQRSLCVYVNNTKKRYQLLKKTKKKKSLWRKRASVLMPWVTPADDFRKICPPQTICSRGFAIQAWSVINRNKRCVLCSLYLSLVWMHRLKIK